MNQKGLLFIITSMLLIALGAGGTYLLMTNSSIRIVDQVAAPVEQASPTLIPTLKPEPTTVIEEQGEPGEAPKSNIPEGWSTYKSSEYGFEISYPESFKALDDDENLYGWPKAVVLFYAGGQSYDLAVEVWDTKSEYEDKHKGQISDLTVKRIGNKYITLLNTNREAQVDQIIETFKAID